MFAPADGGTTLSVRVSAGASRTRIVGPHAGGLKLSVQAPPEKGKANAQARALLAEAFGVPREGVEIRRGGTSPKKLVFLPLSAQEALARWAGRRKTA